MSTAATGPVAQPQALDGTPRRSRLRGPRRDNGTGPSDSQTDRPSHQGQRSSQRGGGRARSARDGLLALRPASVAPPSRSQPQSAEPSSADVSAAENPSPRRQRRERGSNIRRQEKDGTTGQGQQSGHKQRINTSRTFQGRQFGGQLTVENSASAAASGLAATAASELQADASEFRPGQQHGHSVASRRGPVQPQRKRRPSKSTASDIATRIHEDIDNGQYECAICTNEVLRNSKVWSCRTCWTVFHLSCIKKWSSNQGSALAQQERQNGEMPSPRQWRCPGCNLPQETLPSTFICWCKKELEPRPFVGLPPFSCGQTCSRPHLLPKRCPHPCPSICHAGPCPPCTHMGPTQTCFCGKESATRRCVDTDYENGWSCGRTCGELMPCGQHVCERSCHEGLCGACEVRVDARCYCGQVENSIICCEKNDEKTSKRAYPVEDGETIIEEWTGSFECGNVCHREFDCGTHHCEKSCHSQDAAPAHCPRSPDIVTHCPCGKTTLGEITNTIRRSCEDPIPNCNKPCLKPLSCGHPCQQACHSEDCLPCLKVVSITCRCGRTTSSTICHQGTEEPPQCMRICRVTLNCGRHECGERCCTGERKAAERQANKRKLRPLSSATQPVNEGFEAEQHICIRPCGRGLKCGNHACQDLCHKGPCGSCREAVFDEISCHCGRTVLQPPLPCGTTPPPCRFNCERSKACGHPQVPHNCHMDDESCPKCPFLTVKQCLCGKNQLKNQPCWLSEVRCGEICGRKLRCGAHSCRKPCHKPGDCEDVDRPCQQDCGKEKSCGHPCSDTCHSPYACKEDKPCQHKIRITCDCQRIRQEAKCNATKDSEILRIPLKCDEECARLERNRKLALALNIDPDAHKDDHIPYSSETLRTFQANPQWAQAQEKEFRMFAANASEKRLRFKPMSSPQRAFLHTLAEDFGLDSESMDPEPHRHVAIFKTPRFVTVPTKTLAECVRIRHNQRIATTTAVAEASKKLKASNTVAEPYNSFLLTNARFGLTLEELRAVIRPELASKTPLQFDISFLPSEEVVFKVVDQSRISSERDLESSLADLKTPLAKSLKSHALGSLELCRVDASLNIIQRESDSASTGGWSQVAAKAAAPMRMPQQSPFGGKSAFTVLSTKATLAKKKKKADKKKDQDNVVEDWEHAFEVEEQKERAAESGFSGDDEGISDGMGEGVEAEPVSEGHAAALDGGDVMS